MMREKDCESRASQYLELLFEIDSYQKALSEMEEKEIAVPVFFLIGSSKNIIGMMEELEIKQDPIGVSLTHNLERIGTTANTVDEAKKMINDTFGDVFRSMLEEYCECSPHLPEPSLD